MDEPRNWPGDAIVAWLRVAVKRNRRLVRAVTIVLVLAGLWVGAATGWHLYQAREVVWQPRPLNWDLDWIASERVVVSMSKPYPVIDIDSGVATMIVPLARRPDERSLCGLSLTAANERGDLAVVGNVPTRSSRSSALVATSINGELVEHWVERIGWSWGGLVGAGDGWELYAGGELSTISKREISHRGSGAFPTKGDKLGLFWRERWFAIDAQLVEKPEFRAVFEAVDAEGDRYPLAIVWLTEPHQATKPRLGLLGASVYQGNIDAGVRSARLFELRENGLILNRSYLDEQLGVDAYELDTSDWVVVRDAPRSRSSRCRENQKIVEPAQVRSVVKCSPCRYKRIPACPTHVRVESGPGPSVSVYPTFGGHVFVNETAARFIRGDDSDHILVTPGGRLVLINAELSRLKVFDENLEPVSDRPLTFSAQLRLETLRDGRGARGRDRGAR